MKYLLLIFISLTLAYGEGKAQIGSHVPQYAAYYHPLNTRWDSTYSTWSGNGGIATTKKSVNAYLYPAGSFAAPAGWITHIYVAGNDVTNYYTGKNYYEPVALCMGYTALPNFDTLEINAVQDTAAAKAVLYGLQRVAITDSLRCIDSATMPQPLPYTDKYPPHNDGMWVKIKLDNPFLYDPSKNLVVAGDINITYGEGGIEGHLGVARLTNDSAADYGGLLRLQHSYALYLTRDTATGSTYNVTIQKEYMDLGFDIEPLSVSELYELQQGYKVYPNPTRGLLTVDKATTVGAYEVYDLMGRRVLRGWSATAVIQVDALPAGMYLLRFVQEGIPRQLRFIKE